MQQCNLKAKSDTCRCIPKDKLSTKNKKTSLETMKRIQKDNVIHLLLYSSEC